MIHETIRNLRYHGTKATIHAHASHKSSGNQRKSRAEEQAFDADVVSEGQFHADSQRLSFIQPPLFIPCSHYYPRTFPFHRRDARESLLVARANHSRTQIARNAVHLSRRSPPHRAKRTKLNAIAELEQKHREHACVARDRSLVSIIEIRRGPVSSADTEEAPSYSVHTSGHIHPSSN